MPPRTPPPARDLGGGLCSVPVPIPANPLGYTLVYVLESARGPVLIDAGWDHPDSWTALRDGLDGFGLSVAEVYGVVVTHHHPDHAGLAGRVREASGAWIAMHHADGEVVRRIRKMSDQDRVEWRVGTLRRAGASESELAAFANWTGMAEPPVQPDRELADGDLADVPGRALRTVWTPGHTPGHICLHLQDSGQLFTGDHVLPTITPHIGLYDHEPPQSDPLGDFLGSLDRIADMSVAEILPAHEDRFTGLGARVRAIGRHHDDRLVEVAELLSGTPSSLWEVARGMHWKYPWERQHPLTRQLATGEAASHLRLLEVRGEARRADEGGMIRYVRAEPEHPR